MPLYDTPAFVDRSFLQAVSDFIFVKDSPEKADIIFVPGSSFEGHVRLAGQLYLEGYAPKILPSGFHPKGSSAVTGDPAFPSEWAWMRSLLLEMQVPDADILREDRATFTWENAVFSKQVLLSEGIPLPGTALLTCKAHHARRALYYYQSVFPDTRFLVCTSDVPGISADDWHLTVSGRNAVMGEVQRLGGQIREILEAQLS